MMTSEQIYWGVLCRTCLELVAFGASHHLEFEMERAYAKPGAIRCSNGHNHIYFPRDFRFIPSKTAISDEAMRANRETHSAVNFNSWERREDVRRVGSAPEQKGNREAVQPDAEDANAWRSERANKKVS